MATNLPTDIEATYPDASPGDAAHQAHHDAVHAYTNGHDAAADPHGDRAYADATFAVESTDPWHTVGGAGEPAFLNSWANYSADVAAQFRKDSAGNVHLRGMVTGGASATKVFDLPAGYHPNGVWVGAYTAAGSGSTATMLVEVNPTGGVYVTTVTGAPTRWNLALIFNTY